jgi:hypothetical protein
MKKLKAKLPGGGSIMIDVHEIPIPADGSMSAAEYRKALRDEEEYDRKLQVLAEEVADRLDSAERGDRAIEYFDAGKLMLDHERQVEEKTRRTARTEYEETGRTQSRLVDKVKEIRRERGAKKAQYSPNYFRKFIRFAKLMTREQASRPVSYSLQHELIYERLTPQDRDVFLDRCERGDIKTNYELRKLVKEFLARKVLAASESGPPVTEGAT